LVLLLSTHGRTMTGLRLGNYKNFARASI
jgi:hypothetical protein